ncbi:MAG TPA: hypothetical protein VMU71_07420 [Terracidiphilus sp.]|nr:hypothetical protein [Terracidiphilus sp.]
MPEEPLKLFGTLADRLPEKGDGDRLRENAQAAIAAIPLVGGATNLVLDRVFPSAFRERLKAWQRELAEIIEDLRRRVGDLEAESRTSEKGFVTAVYQATAISLATHRKEKHEYLHNALLNIGIGNSPSEDLRQIFLKAIDDLTPLHITILKFLHKGTTQMKQRGLWSPQNSREIKSFTAAILALHPDLRPLQDTLTHVITDLYNCGFTPIRTADQSFPQSPAITNHGTAFLSFIKEPPR